MTRSAVSSFILHKLGGYKSNPSTRKYERVATNVISWTDAARNVNTKRLSDAHMKELLKWLDPIDDDE